MKEKILTSTIILLTIFSSIVSISYNIVEAQNISNEPDETILQEITQTQNKTLTVDKIIGDRHVKYWEHIINDVYVKNDSILLHLDPITGDILEYQKTWTDIKIDLLEFEQKISKNHQNYIWKKKVVFPDENDTIKFCTFYNHVEYPLMCWEIRYTDGTTTLYDFQGIQIGHYIPTPRSEGLAIQGYGDPDWRLWRDNAQEWFQKWCDGLQSQVSPDLSWVSERISDPDVDLFYVIAHSGGQPDRFLVKQGVYYNATRLHNDMSSRNPIKLAVLCCCSAMDDTGPGTLSYEFRKGQIDDTVTIGYYDMGSCPGWPWDALYWQDFMFEKIDQGYKVKKAFDLARAEYPLVDGYVKFVGDENLRIKNTPPETYIYVHAPSGRYIGPYPIFDTPTPNRQDLELDGKVGRWYTFKATAPISHPFWPDTKDPTPGGRIVQHQWKQTVVDHYGVVDIQQIRDQNYDVNPIGILDFIEESEIDAIGFRWDEPGTYKVTLTVEDDDGATSSTTITMRITRIFVNEQIEQFQTKYLAR